MGFLRPTEAMCTRHERRIPEVPFKLHQSAFWGPKRLGSESGRGPSPPRKLWIWTSTVFLIHEDSRSRTPMGKECQLYLPHRAIQGYITHTDMHPTLLRLELDSTWVQSCHQNSNPVFIPLSSLYLALFYLFPVFSSKLSVCSGAGAVHLKSITQ